MTPHTTKSASADDTRVQVGAISIEVSRMSLTLDKHAIEDSVSKAVQLQVSKMSVKAVIGLGTSLAAGNHPQLTETLKIAEVELTAVRIKMVSIAQLEVEKTADGRSVSALRKAIDEMSSARAACFVAKTCLDQDQRHQDPERYQQRRKQILDRLQGPRADKYKERIEKLMAARMEQQHEVAEKVSKRLIISKVLSPELTQQLSKLIDKASTVVTCLRKAVETVTATALTNAVVKHLEQKLEKGVGIKHPTNEHIEIGPIPFPISPRSQTSNITETRTPTRTAEPDTSVSHTKHFLISDVIKAEEAFKSFAEAIVTYAESVKKDKQKASSQEKVVDQEREKLFVDKTRKALADLLLPPEKAQFVLQLLDRHFRGLFGDMLNTDSIRHAAKAA